jgi:predicted  nucleic acid-binding Zn-ribbon protein
MKILNLFNKRKREIERLNVVIDRLIERNEQLEKSVRVMKAERDLSERALTTANKNILDLTNEVGYLKMQVDNSKDKNDSRYY